MKIIPKQIAIAIAMACGAASSANGVAGEYDSRLYIAPGLSYTLPDSNRKADNGGGAFFGIGKPVTENISIELVARANELDLSNGKSTYNQRALMLDGLYFLDRKAVLAPYAVAGLGAIQSAVNGGSSKNIAANVGVGALYSVGKEGLGIRADVRYRMDFDDKSVAGRDNFGDVAFNLGLVLPLGKGKSESVAVVEPAPMAVTKAAPAVMAAPVVVAAPVAPKVEPTPVAKAEPAPTAPIVVAAVDTDKDGVPDSADKCANTRTSAKVDAKGCDLDGDGDGIADASDVCANTPAGIKVNATGCEVDSDNDKVADSSDQCANTPAGVKVDAKGCTIPAVAALNKVQFGFGNAVLDDSSKKALDAVAAELKANPNHRVNIAGYTDAVGTDTFNKKLSEERARAVSGYLAKHGVSAATLRIQSFGETKPVATNDTDAGRALNRRVEMFVTNE